VTLALALAGAGCGSGAPAAPSTTTGGAGGSATGGTGGMGGQGMDDPDPTFSAEEMAALKTLAPAALPKAPADVSNKWADDAKAAAFGQRLFFDPRFAGEMLDGDNNMDPMHALGDKGETGKVACAGCHLPESGFVDTRTVNQQISLGAGWGIRRSPSVLDVAQSRLIMWDGRHDALYNQVFGPLESQVEMNSSRLYGAQQMFANHKAEYEAIFGPLPPLDDTTRFPKLDPKVTGCRKLDAESKCVGKMRGAPGDGAEYDALSAEDKDAVTRVWVNFGKAVGAYERLLSCGQGRFDKWMNGDKSALDRSEQRGAALFAGKGKCVSCHSGPFMSDERFHNVGLQPAVVAVVFIDGDDPGASVGLPLAKADPLNVAGKFSDGDDGRLPAAVVPEMEGAFRTPRLRCISRHPSFMHTGQFRTLEEVMAFFGRGGDQFGYRGKSELANVGLSVRERNDLIAFIKALEGPGPDAKLLAKP
jgi:cytochrome c peroxidase